MSTPTFSFCIVIAMTQKQAPMGALERTRDKGQIIEEPDEVKVCAVSRTDEIAN
jgi:hypothetical protein